MSDKVLAMRGTRWLIFCVALLLATAPAAAQETFKRPEDAVDALIGAAKSGDKSAILRILGPNGRDIVSSGDDVADRTTRENFVAAYDTKHSLSPDGAAKTDLIIGDDDWLFPIPLVSANGSWRFDTNAGLDEILRRRVGRNEHRCPHSTFCFPWTALRLSAQGCLHELFDRSVDHEASHPRPSWRRGARQQRTARRGDCQICRRELLERGGP